VPVKLSIAVIGWGSLLWDPRGLRVAQSGWRPDGPLLPIEYLHISGIRKPPKRLTLVLADRTAHKWVEHVRTLWAMSIFDDLEDARTNLAVREGSDVALVGYLAVPRAQHQATASSLRSITDATERDRVLAEVRDWLKYKELDAAIWADLSASPDLDGLPTTEDNAIAFLKSLKGTDRDAAQDYVRRTPAQVRTPIRLRVEEDIELKWTPRTVSAPINTADDLRFKDWTEARAAIARFDAILVDLRKVGFSVITGLLAASALVGFLGIPASTEVNTSTWPIEARSAVWAVLVSLVVLLFVIDVHFEVLLSGAVERALDIELQTDPPVRLTKYLSVNVQRIWAAKLIFWMYVGLSLLVVGLAVLMLQLATEIERAKVLLWVVPILVFGVLFVFIYGQISRERTHTDRLKERPWPEGSEKIPTGQN
jgi:hypothetical protein